MPAPWPPTPPLPNNGARDGAGGEPELASRLYECARSTCRSLSLSSCAALIRGLDEDERRRVNGIAMDGSMNEDNVDDDDEQRNEQGKDYYRSIGRVQWEYKEEGVFS